MKLKISDLRVGNYLRKDGVIVQIDARSIFDIWNETKEYEPILLTETNILAFKRKVIKPEIRFSFEFSKTLSEKEELENNFLSKYINDEYRLRLSPLYDFDWIDDKIHVKRSLPEWWFCWYISISNTLPVKNIKGENRLMYVHQLQNLFYNLSGFDLVF